MTKNFKDMSPKQIQRLAEKNRKASQENMEAEYSKRGIARQKKKNTVYVDRSEDPKINHTSHRTLFNEMKRKPYS